MNPIGSSLAQDVLGRVLFAGTGANLLCSVAGTPGAPNYPIDTGLTVEVLPFEKLQAEAGFDPYHSPKASPVPAELPNCDAALFSDSILSNRNSAP